MAASTEVPDLAAHGARSERVPLLLRLLIVGGWALTILSTSPKGAPAQAPELHKQSGRSLRDVLLDAGGVNGEDVALAPGGDAVAYSVTVPLRFTLRHFGDARVGRLFVATTRSWKPTRLAGPDRYATAFVDLSWSPNGRWLAFRQTRGVESRIQVWDRRQRRIVHTSACMRFDPAVLGPSVLGWTADQQLIFARGSNLCPDSITAEAASGEVSVGIADAWIAWRTRGLGRTPAVSVLKSGEPPDSVGLPVTEIWLLSMATGQQRRVAAGSFVEAYLSPDRRSLALLRQVSFDMPPAGTPLQSRLELPFGYAVTVATLDGVEASLLYPPQGSALRHTISWSPDGTHVAFGAELGSSDCWRSVVIYDVRTRALATTACASSRRVPTQQPDGLTDSSEESGRAAFAWLGPHLPVLRMRPASEAATMANGSSRYDWYALRPEGNAINITHSLGQVPASLVSTAFGAVFVDRGRLTTVSIRSHEGAHEASVEIAELAPWLIARVVKIEEAAGTPGDLRLRVMLEGERTSRRAVLHVRSRTTVLLPEESPAAAVAAVGVDANREAVIVLRYDSLGRQTLTIELTAPRERHVLFATSRGTVPPAVFPQRSISYRSERGEALVATVTLPVDLCAKRPYPTVVIVYPGDIQTPFSGEQRARLSENQMVDSPALFAAHGYVVLEPSMPYHFGMGSTDQPIDELTNGVLPALDEAVRRGLTDSSRVAVAGHSAGAYAVVGLLTQTTKFRAAIAAAGPTNFITGYGALFPESRYGGAGQYDIRSIYEEGTQDNLHVPPWQDPSIFVHNSPFFAVDRIRTPLLLIHGDQDRVPVEESVQLFSALRRLGRPAELVRYWGEGHNIRGYHNMLDYETRVSGWLGKYLDLPADASSSCR